MLQNNYENNIPRVPPFSVPRVAAKVPPNVLAPPMPASNAVICECESGGQRERDKENVRMSGKGEAATRIFRTI